MQKKRQLLEHPLVVFVSAVIAIVFILGAVNAYIQKRRVSAEYLALSEKIQKRAEDIGDLERRLSDIESGRGLEREARENLNLKKDGEEVLIIVGDEEEKTPAIAETAGIWERLKRWFGFD